jgi:hypothetical protein
MVPREGDKLRTQKPKPSWWVKTLKKNIHHGCLHCGGTDAVLPMDTKLYKGMGGWKIMRDDKLFFEDDQFGREWEDWTELKDIERKARRDIHHDWRAVFDLPLRGGQYQRHRGKWVLIESNRGFA